MALKKRAEEEVLEAPGYMMLYSVLMTLLMAFFIALATMGTYGGQKFQKVVGSVREAFELFPPGGPGAFFRDLLTQGLGKQTFIRQNLRYERSRLMVLPEERPPTPGKHGVHDMKLRYERVKRFVVPVSEVGVFAAGATALTDTGREFLQQVIRVYRDQPAALAVTGFVGPVPAALPAEPAWTLALARARVVADYLHEHGGIGYDQLTVLGTIEETSEPDGFQPAPPRVEITFANDR